MTAQERRAILSLSGVYVARMLGLFMVLPVLVLYAEGLHYVTPFLIGLAIGIYGLTQAMLQIPLGLLSDRVGRRPVIIGGLTVFMLGGAVAALSDSIYGIIAGRALQGAGAIAAATLALAADLTRENQRTKAMAAIGISIGAAFVLAMIFGPLVSRWFGVAGVFWLSVILGGLAIALVATLAPQIASDHPPRDTEPFAAAAGRVLRDAQLLRLDFGVFILHLMLTANFVAVPLLLRDAAGIESTDHWLFYLPVLLLSLAIAAPLIFIFDRHRYMKTFILGGITVLAAAECAYLFIPHNILGMAVLLTVFFAAFNLLEAVLPSLTSRLAPADGKGAALGVYSTAQFLGIFAGGALGGWVYGQFGVTAVFMLGLGAACLWLLASAGMENPRALSEYALSG